MSFRFLGIVVLVAALIPVNTFAQKQSFALPSHPGAMVLDLEGFTVTQTSAKPDNREIGVRAHDTGHTELLAFLFLTPESRAHTAKTCLEQDLKQIRIDNGKFTEQLDPAMTDTPEAVTMVLTYPNGSQTFYKYAGTADQCLVIQVYPDRGNRLDPAQAAALLDRQRYDPLYSPTPQDVATYQAIRGRSYMVSGAAPVDTRIPETLVAWNSVGGIVLPHQAEWKLVLLTAYDSAARPAAEFTNDASKVTVSFLISENLSGVPTAEGCRKDIVDGILAANRPIISNAKDGSMSDGHGGTFATHSHLTLLNGTDHNHDVFAFAGNAQVCAEIHASTVSGKSNEDERLQSALALFHPDLSDRPNCADYVAEASVFFKQEPLMGAPFYDSCLNTIPNKTTDPSLITIRRLATDQVVIALGMAGKIDQSRAYAERAIKLDPDYPLYYYNLACADAEQGKAADAKVHLQQAFERKANTLPGEHFPDPTQDDSIRKLKKNKEFWAFVQTLK
jgi:tetratricopeptide (TPR) repeat protein